MKILIAVTSIPPTAGGAEKVAWETAKRLAEYPDTQVHIATIGSGGTEMRDGVTIHHIPKKPLLTLYYSTFGRNAVRRLLKECDFDVVHIHMLLPWAYLFRHSDAGKVLTLHGYDTYRIRWFERYFTSRAVGGMDEITAPSKWLCGLAGKRFGRGIVHITNGVDTDRYRNESGTPGSGVLYFGRYEPEKGIRELLEVAAKLPDREFRFAGKGSLDPLIKGRNVRNLGLLTGKDLVDEINKAQVCVFPSKRENMPLAGLEALSCGKAVICTPEGFSEYVTDGVNGLIVPPGDTGALKAAIEKLTGDDAFRKELEKAARDTALRYGWAAIVERYHGIYVCLCGCGEVLR